MKLHNIAINNLRRRKGKVLFLLAGLILGVATVISLHVITSTMEVEMAKKLDEYGANIVVTPRSEGMALSYGGMDVSGVTYNVEPLLEKDVAKIYEIPSYDSISIISPKIIGSVPGLEEGQVLTLIGVDFTREFRMKPWLILEQGELEEVPITRKVEIAPSLGNGDHDHNSKPLVQMNLGQILIEPDEIVLGNLVARDLSLELGDTLALKDKEYTIVGILERTGAQEDTLIFIDMEEARHLLDRDGEYTVVEISALCIECPIEELVNQISQVLPGAEVIPLRQVVQSRDETVARFANFAIALSAVVLVIGILVVLTTMMSSVNERTREIGIFRAIGFRKIHIVKIVLLEALIISLVGGSFGYFAGITVARVVGPTLAGMELPIYWDFSLLPQALLVATVIGLLGSLYPAWKAANLDPAEALRFI